MMVTLAQQGRWADGDFKNIIPGRGLSSTEHHHLPPDQQVRVCFEDHTVLDTPAKDYSTRVEGKGRITGVWKKVG